MLGSGFTRVALVCGVLAVAAIGCGDASGNDPTSAAPMTVATTSLPGSDAFDAFRRASDEATAKLAAAAATGSQDRFDAAYHDVHRMFDTSSALKELQTAGIVCNAR